MCSVLKFLLLPMLVPMPLPLLLPMLSPITRSAGCRPPPPPAECRPLHSATLSPSFTPGTPSGHTVLSHNLSHFSPSSPFPLIPPPVPCPSEIEGLRRKLTLYLSPEDPVLQMRWEVGTSSPLCRASRGAG